MGSRPAADCRGQVRSRLGTRSGDRDRNDGGQTRVSEQDKLGMPRALHVRKPADGNRDSLLHVTAPAPDPTMSGSVHDETRKREMRAILRPAKNHDAFMRNPYGTYVTGPSWLIFVTPNRQVSGMVLWEEPDEAAMDQAVPLLEHRLAFAPHPSVIDARGLTHVDPLAFASLHACLSKAGLALSRVVTRSAVLHGEGLVGAVVAGFAASLQIPIEVQMFRDPTDALTWLGLAEERDLYTEIESIVARAREAGSTIGQLGAVLESNPNLTLLSGAMALGLSPRSLQRKLFKHKTTFQRELDAARVRAARRLLASSEANLSRVAQAVGLGSAEALCSLFRRAVGQAPADFRRSDPRSAVARSA
jgi:AraC-like DNA-binding protein